MKFCSRATVWCVLPVALSLAACDCDSGGGGDSEPDAAVQDAGVDAALPRAAAFVTSGGGESESSTHRLRISVGSPQPMGIASGETHRIVVGPAAAR